MRKYLAEPKTEVYEAVKNMAEMVRVEADSRIRPKKPEGGGKE